MDNFLTERQIEETTDAYTMTTYLLELEMRLSKILKTLYTSFNTESPSYKERTLRLAATYRNLDSELKDFIQNYLSVRDQKDFIAFYNGYEFTKRGE